MQQGGGKFPRERRLLKPDDYRRVFNDNQKSLDNDFVVLACRNELEHPRLGLAITKKNLRRAVDRNRLKRLIRESFRLHQSSLAGLDIVVVNRCSGLLSSNSHYLTSLSFHWRKLAKKCKLS